MMTIATGPRPLTDAEKEAWTLHLQKVPVPTIQIRTGLMPSQIAAAVDLGQVHAQLAMQSSTAVLLETPSAPIPPKVVVKSARPDAATPAAPTGGGDLTVSELLSWAEQSGLSRPMTLAARVREYVVELRNIQEQVDARAKAQAEVERLTAELEAAKNALRQAGGIVTARAAAGKTKPDAGRRERIAAIRQWAPGAGYEVSALGRIPQHIEDAYDAAHGVKS